MRVIYYLVFYYLFHSAIVVQASVISYSSYLKRSVSKFNTIFAFGDSYSANGSLKDFFANNAIDFEEEKYVLFRSNMLIVC
jgi:hypothetical protein